VRLLGIQSICLTEVSHSFVEVLAGLIGQDAQALITAVEVAVTLDRNSHE